MELAIETSPGIYPVDLIGRYINLVSEYISITHEGYRSREYGFRKRELEKELQQAGRYLKRIHMQTTESSSYYFIKYNRITYKVDLSRTMYIYTYRRKVTFIMDDGSSHETYTRLNDIWEDIHVACPSFRRISQRHIINFMFVNDFSGRNIHIGEQVFHITAKYLSVASDKEIFANLPGIHLTGKTDFREAAGMS